MVYIILLNIMIKLKMLSIGKFLIMVFLNVMLEINIFRLMMNNVVFCRCCCVVGVWKFLLWIFDVNLGFLV